MDNYEEKKKEEAIFQNYNSLIFLEPKKEGAGAHGTFMPPSPCPKSQSMRKIFTILVGRVPILLKNK